MCLYRKGGLKPNSLEKLLDTMLADYGRMGDLPSAVALRQAIRRADPAANAELESQRDNLAAVVRGLVYQVRRRDPGNALSKRAMAYLAAKGLQGSILRQEGADEIAVNMAHSMVDSYQDHNGALILESGALQQFLQVARALIEFSPLSYGPATKLGYCILNAEGEIHWDEACVSSDRPSLQETVDAMRMADPDAGWRVAEFYSATVQKVGEATILDVSCAIDECGSMENWLRTVLHHGDVDTTVITIRAIRKVLEQIVKAKPAEATGDQRVDDMRHALGLDYEEAIADKRRLTRELDVALCGDDAARQASLCDLIPVAKRYRAAVEATVRCFDALPSNSPAREAPLKINGLRALIGSFGPPLSQQDFDIGVAEKKDWGKPLRYLTDDRDLLPRYELVIMHAGNGDWYVSVLPEGDAIGPTVRLCTSGGASSYAPGLTVAISQAYRALYTMRKTS